MTEPKTQTLDVAGAVLRYDTRDAEAESTAPVLLIIGSPMDARGFTTLAEHFRDRTVVTYDPRGIGRSERTDGAKESTAVQVLPDREQALAAVMNLHELYGRKGIGPAMGKFIALTSLKGPIPAGFADQPPPNPADFGLPTEDDGARDDPLVGQNIVSIAHYEPDFDALRAASTRIVLGAGAESEGEMAHRGAVAVAKRLGTEAVIFPGGHAGFLGGEFGMTGDPDGFAATLRQVLTEDG
jgi:hypothetical protein